MTETILQRVVISGGTGMLGRALARRLSARGCEVLMLVNPSSRRTAGLADLPRVSIAPCDITALPAFTAPDDQPWDAFYHMAWGGTFGATRDDLRAQTANIGYALDAVELAERLGCRVFVGAGSQAEYGRVDGMLRPDTPTHPENGYGVAKLAAGAMTRLRCEQLGLRHEWARILSVYGPFDGARTMVMSTITALLAGETPRLTPCGQLWDYLYCDDAAAALHLMGERGRDGAVYCVGSGQARPLRDYVTVLRDAVDPTLPLDIGALPYNTRQVMHLCADITTLRDDTGFTPEVPFEEGVACTVAWVREQHRPSGDKGRA